MADSSAPLLRPPRIHEGHVCALLLGLVAASAVAPALHFARMDGDLYGISTLYARRFLVLSGGIAAAWVGWYSVKEQALIAVLRGLWAGMLGGWVAVWAAVGFLCLLSGDIFGLLGGLLVGFYGLPPGLLFGLVAMIPIWVASMHRHNPSHEGPDDTMRSVGVWASFLLVASCMVASSSFARWSAILCLVLTLAMTVLGAWRMHARRQFLQRVRAGEEPGWALETISAEEQTNLLPLLERLDLNAPILGLVKYESRDTGYRAEAGSRRVIALVEG